VSLLSSIQSSVSSAANKVQKTVSNAANSVTGAARSAANTLTSAASTAASTARNTVSNNISSSVNSVKTQVSSVGNTVKQDISNTVSSVSNTKNSIQNTVSSYGQQAANLAGNAVQRVENSISNSEQQAQKAAQAAQEAAQRAAQSATQAAQRAAQQAADQATARVRQEQEAARRIAEQAAAAARAEEARLKAIRDKENAEWSKKQQEVIKAAQAASKQASNNAGSVVTSLKSSASELKANTEAAKNNAVNIISSIKNSTANTLTSINKTPAIVTAAKALPSVLINPIGNVTSASILPSINIPSVNIPSVSIPTSIKNIGETVSNAGSKLSTDYDKFYQAKNDNYGKAVEKIESGKTGEGIAQFGGTLALDVILPMDAVNVGNKILSGRSEEISKEDLFWAGIDVISLIPTPVTMLGGNALKASMTGIKVIDEGSKATKALKASDAVESGFYGAEKAIKAGESNKGKIVTGAAIAGGSAMGLKTTKLTEFLDALKTSKVEDKAVKTIPAISTIKSTAGLNSVTAAKGLAGLDTASALKKLASVQKSALSARTIKDTSKINSAVNVAAIEKANMEALQTTYKAIQTKSTGTLKSISSGISASLAKLAGVKAAEKTAAKSMMAELSAAKAAAAEVQQAANLKKLSATQTALKSRTAKDLSALTNSVKSTIKPTVTAAKVATGAGAATLLKLGDEAGEGLKALSNTVESSKGYKIIKTQPAASEGFYSLGKVGDEASSIKSIEAADSAKGFESVKIGEDLKGTKPTAAAVQSLSTLDKAKAMLKKAVMPIGASLAGAGIYSMLSSDTAKTVLGQENPTPAGFDPNSLQDRIIILNPDGSMQIMPANTTTDAGNATGTAENPYSIEDYKKALQKANDSYLSDIQKMFDDFNTSLTGADSYWDDLNKLYDQYKNGEINKDQYESGLDDIYSQLGEDYADGNISPDEYAQYEDAIQGLQSGDPTKLESLEPDLITKVWNWICEYWMYIFGGLVLFIVLKWLNNKASRKRK
jgi:hypothetical protein